MRLTILSALLLATLAAASARAQDSQPAAPLGEFDQALMDRVNHYRASKHKPPLLFSDLAWHLAREHSLRQAKTRNMGHDGFGERTKKAEKALGQRLGGVAENVAMCSQGYDNVVETIFQGWRRSKTHNDNMLGDSTHGAISGVKNKKGEWYFTHLFLTIRQ